MGKHKNKRDSKVSSGKRKASKINTQLKRLQMKISRWNRYKEEVIQGKRKGSVDRWNTSGLEKHMELLGKL